MPARITKSNKFKDLQSKLLMLSYLSIKFRKFGTLKKYHFMCQTWGKKTTPERYQKLEFQTLKTTTSTPTTLPYKNPPGRLHANSVILFY